MRRPRLLPLLAACLFVLAATHAPEAIITGPPFPEPLTLVPTDLESLHAEWLSHTMVRSGTAFRPMNTLLSVVADQVMIDAVASGNVDGLKADLQALGMQQIVVFGRTISGRLPVSSIGALSGLPHLQFARPALSITSAGLVTSQGDKATRADVARTTFGVDGTGVSVGVLSDSFNCLGGAAGDVANGDLPPVTVLQELPACTAGTDEGRAMLQIVHDGAPGANLLFATASTGQAGFATNILNLAAAGADIIVDDVLYLAEPMFQDGIIAQAVDVAVAAGVPYFSAAGNQGRAAYQAGFVNTGINLGTPSAPFLLHDFDGGSGTDLLQTVTFPPGLTTIVFQWSTPAFSVSGAPGAQTDMDLALFDMNLTFLFGAFTDNLGGDPVEILIVSNPNAAPVQAQLAIGKFAGPDPVLMKYVAFSPGFVIDEFPTHSGTIYGHPNAAGAQAVGAAAFFDTPEFGVTPPIVEGFSSRGTTPILFTTAGVPTFDPRTKKPGIVAPDGANTTFFGTDIASDGDTFPNFFGTSAAAPHAAAVAALLLDAVPTLTPSAVYAALESTAIDMGAPGFDNDSGFGLIRADAAIASVLPAVTITVSDGVAGETGPDLGTFTVNRSGATTAPLTVNYTVSGSATSGSDYTALPGSVTIPAGSASASIVVAPIDDAVVAEGSETVVVTVATGAGYLVGTPGSGVVTIADNDPVVVTITATDPAAAETGPDPGTFTVTRTGPTTSALTVVYAVTGTATASSDYVTLPGSVVIPVGSASATITVTPVDDAAIGEGDETVIVTLSAAAGYALGTPSAGTVTIADDDPVLVTIAATTPAASETGPSAGTFTVSRNGPTTAALTVDYSIGGTAMSGSDYTALTGSVTIAAGASSASIEVTPIDDAAIGEGNETVVVTISAGAGYTVGSPSSGTVTIADNDPVVVTIAATTPSASEAGPAIGSLTVSRSGPTTAALAVTYSVAGTATPGSDYTALTGSVTIDAGAASAPITISPVDDAAIGEGNETVVVTLTAGTGYVVGATSEATVTIADNDPPPTELTCDVPVTAAIGTPAETDLYTFTVADGEIVRISVGVAAPSDPAFQTTWRLLTAAGQPAAGCGTFSIAGMRDCGPLAAADGPYRIEVSDHLQNHTGSYHLHVQRLTHPCGNVELTCDVPVAATIDSPVESDLYGFNVVEGEIVRISVIVDAPSAPAFQTTWRLLTAAGLPATACGDFSIAGTRDCGPLAAAGSPYRIEVAEHLQNDTGTYQVHFQRLTLPCDSAELTCDLPVTATITNPSESDLYGFTVSDGEIVRISVAIASSPDPTFQTTWRLLTGTGQPAAVCGDFSIAGTRDCGPLAAADGPYLIEVAEHLQNDTGSYHLHLQRLTHPCGSEELTCDVPRAATIDNPAESDLYSINVTEGETVRIAVGVVSPSDPGFQPTWRLLTASGAPAPACGAFSIAATRDCGPLAAAGSPYRVETAEHLQNDTGTYQVQFQRLTLPCDTSVVVTIAVTDATAAETGGNTGAFTVSRTGLTTTALTVTYSVGGTATAGMDYVALTGSVTIPAGAASASIIVTPIDDAVMSEGNETVIVTLAAGAGYSVGASSAASVTIADNDLPSVTIKANDPNAAEAAASTGAFTVSRTGVTTAPLTVIYSIGGTAAGTDYLALPGSVVIPAGAKSAVITVKPVDDTLTEGAETVIVTLAASATYLVGSPGTATVTIADNDRPTVTIKAADNSATEAGRTTGRFTVTRTAVSPPAPLTVQYSVSGSATPGSDYVPLSGTVVIPAGSNTATITVTPNDDGLLEAAETVVVTLTPSAAYIVGSAKTATVTLADNDRPTVTIKATDATAAEPGSNTGTFTVTRTAVSPPAALTVHYTVSGSATAGNDYVTLGGSVVIPAGSNTATITVAPLDDALVEGSEKVVVTLAANAAYIVGGAKTATVTLNSNE